MRQAVKAMAANTAKPIAAAVKRNSFTKERMGVEGLQPAELRKVHKLANRND